MPYDTTMFERESSALFASACEGSKEAFRSW